MICPGESWLEKGLMLLGRFLCPQEQVDGIMLLTALSRSRIFV